MGFDGGGWWDVWSFKEDLRKMGLGWLIKRSREGVKD